MSQTPLTSIIIPVYNQAEFVLDALKSALSQTWPNFEIIVIDDASTDNSVQAVSPLLTNRLVSFHRNKTNKDCAYTFNRGIEIAEGDFVAILAADDTWEPTFIERCVRELQQHPEAAFSYTRINLLSARGDKKPRLSDRIKHKSTCCSDEYCNIVRWLNPIPHHATVVRKSCIEHVGPYNEELITTHDWDLWLRLSAIYPAVFINEHLSNYRVHGSNISKQRSRVGVKEKYIIQMLEKVFADKTLPDGLLEEKAKIYARAWLDIAEGYRVVGEKAKMRSSLRKALSLCKNPTLYINYRRLLLSLLHPTG